jgi:hypothetical protein
MASRPQTAAKLSDSATFETKRPRERPRNFSEIDSLIMGEQLAEQEDSIVTPVIVEDESDNGMSDPVKQRSSRSR